MDAQATDVEEDAQAADVEELEEVDGAAARGSLEAPAAGTEAAEELALKALLTRDAKRASEKALAKQAAKDATGAVMSRPAGHVDRVLRRPAGHVEGVLRRPAGHAAARPAPTLDPVHYLQGRLYTDQKGQRVRAYKRKGDKVESGFSYKKRPHAAAWEDGCGAIEEAQ